jgi:hypothetical protein
VKALRRFQRAILGALLCSVATICAVNTLVDPWRVLDLPWSLDALERSRDVETVWSRTAKTGLARSGEWDGALFGTSRIGSGLRPDHPAFDDLRMVNLGLDGGPLWVGQALLREFLAHQRARLVVFSIDVVTLYTPPAPDPADFDLSPLNPHGDRFERTLRYVTGFSTFVVSVRTLGRWLTGRTPLHTRAGLRRWSGPEDRAAAIETFFRSIAGRTRSIGPTPALHPEMTAIVEDVIARTTQAGARLVLLVPPDHALLQVVTHDVGPQGFYYQEARRFLARAVAEANARHPDGPPAEYWDFLDLHPVNCEPLPADPRTQPMRYWFDLVHISPLLADIMVDRMMGADADIRPPYGTRLRPDDVEAYLAGLPSALAEYVRAHPADVAYMRETLGLPPGGPMR